MNKLLIGTSGYDYPDWKGIFYPQDMKRDDFLSYYATQFNGLELNNTFYSVPTREKIASYIDRTEGKVSFCIKATKIFTHEIVKDWKYKAMYFCSAIVQLKEKGVLSSLLFQLPESFGYTSENRIYLANLLEYFKHFYPVVEFRNKDWVKESVFEGIKKLGASVVFCAMPRLIKTENGFESQFIGNMAYARLHPTYSLSQIRDFVPIIECVKEEKKNMQVYFNNTQDGLKGAIYLRNIVFS